MYPAADWVDGYVVFDVCGNKYRMITQIYFDTNDVLVRHVLTQKDYDKGDWKK